MTLLSATIILLLVMDPVGNIPLFISCLKEVKPERRRIVALREIFFAFLILCAALFAGGWLLGILQISQSSLSMAGAIILFLIAIRLVFPGTGPPLTDSLGGEPFLFPLAIPLLAGPSAITTVILFATKEPGRLLQWFLAVLIACVLTGIILSLSEILLKFMGKRGIVAIERLMGLLLTAVAVEMFVRGLKTVLSAG